MFAARLMFLRIAAAVSCLILAACGSGGGGGDGAAEDSSTAPYILAAVLSFPETNVPPAGFVPVGFNSEASVAVLDSATGEPITNASVSVNGVPLAYVPADQDYEGGISVNPGSTITLSVTVGSTTYTSTATQFTAYPTITSPLTDATWVSTEANLAAWSGVAPTASSLYALGVFDTNGELVWPYGSVQILPTTTTSYTVPPSSLTTGDRLLIVGLMDLVEIPNADPDSGLIIGGFNYVPITVVNVKPVVITLQSITVTPDNPTVTVGKTKQLTATGSYSDGSTQDLTAQVTWQSSDSAKATVSITGVVSGLSYGSATVTATLGSISGSTLVNVFQPTPSPAPPLSQSVTYQIDYAHSGRAVFPDPVTFPASPAWSRTLNGAISYPLIAGGKVYVTTSGTGGTIYGTSLYALDAQSGDIAWGPVTISGTYHWSAAAYDHGKIFVINFDGLLRSFDAVTGTPGWSKQLPNNQYWFDSPPTAVNGIVYVGGSGSGGTLYAVDETTGNVLWTAAVANGNQSAPAVSSDGVFVSYPCQVYKFDPITGESLWHYSGPCQGGGGETSAYANGLLYVRDPILSLINNPSSPEPPGRIYDATTGTQVGTFSADPIPALGTTTGFFLTGGALQAVNLVSHTVLWSFAGDGELVSAPIIINQFAIVGSRSGNVYAIDAGTGQEEWSRGAGSAIAGSFEGGLNQPPTGLGAGEGYLVVPAGNVLTAWKLSGP